MEKLFSIEPKFPDGFYYKEEFITEEEEAGLIQLFNVYKPETFIFHSYEAKRKTISFGYDYSFNTAELLKGKPIPSEFDFLIDKVSTSFEIKRNDIAELLLIEYPPGSVINWHRDAPPFDVIVGVSLNADCIFRLRPYKKELQGRNNIVSINVKRRSVYILKNSVRTEW